MDLQVLADRIDAFTMLQFLCIDYQNETPPVVEMVLSVVWMCKMKNDSRVSLMKPEMISGYKK